MQSYIGVKLVQAQEFTRAEFNKYKFDDDSICPPDASPDDEGYMVKYPDGYESWCPKKQFEEANRQIDGMTFGHAIQHMNTGGKVCLPKWADDVYISIQVPGDKSKMTAPYFYVTSRFGLVPWIPTMIEMLAEDWSIVD